MKPVLYRQQEGLFRVYYQYSVLGEVILILKISMLKISILKISNVEVKGNLRTLSNGKSIIIGA